MAFNFDVSCLDWIGVFYSDISICIMNNGFAPDTFEVSREVRQGDPLSPCYLLILLLLLKSSIQAFVKTKLLQELKLVNVGLNLASL